jgi:hypothetical protein
VNGIAPDAIGKTSPFAKPLAIASKKLFLQLQDVSGTGTFADRCTQACAKHMEESERYRQLHS